MSSGFDNDYRLMLQTLKEKIRQARQRGTKTFNTWKDLKFDLHQYFYYIRLFTSQDVTIMECLYDQVWSQADIDQLAETFAEAIVDDVAQNIERIQSKK